MRRGHDAIQEVPTAILMAAQLREHHDTWLQALRSRLANLASPDPDLGQLIPDYLERCERRLFELDVQLLEVRKTGSLEESDLEAFETHRDALAQVCEHAIRLLVH
jgi:hypothetical protein